MVIILCVICDFSCHLFVIMLACFGFLVLVTIITIDPTSVYPPHLQLTTDER
jgi:hypothetical protein